MDITRLSEGLAVSPQVTREELPALAAAGFRAVVCNRPDKEEAGQPDFAEIAAAARALGLEARHIPVDDSHPVAMQKDLFAQALDELPQPVLAYCRTGNRCTKLYEAVSGDAPD